MSQTPIRRRIVINGLVQGVGFRPFVYNLAGRHGLTGFVTNTTEGVTIEVEGDPVAVAVFVDALRKEKPPLAMYSSLVETELEPCGALAFVIAPSTAAGRPLALITPDAAVCRDCAAELLDPADRRYRYPFINCTNCGPRFTITNAIPYDRPNTAMHDFAMCPACLAEYHDPGDRRFHAQPNACPVCGPEVVFVDGAGLEKVRGDQAVAATVRLLQEGRIMAIKGLGGFHLAVDAANDSAVFRLRERKLREEKPLAVMVRDLAAARRLCVLTEDEEMMLASPQSPIVLAPKRPGHPLADSVAPDTDLFGIMLAYTPLHLLLLEDGPAALVMTSGNRSDEPICITNREAMERLQGIADGSLIHNRGIFFRNDDSIVMRMAGHTRLVRRSRGYVPAPIALHGDGPPVLAVGGELKNTICLLRGREAFMSQHLGDMETLAAVNGFHEAVGHLLRILRTHPVVVVHDLHPDYRATRWALAQGDYPVLGVQHHHAHLASCLAENGKDGPAIGLIMDGTGFGTDGTIWGAEVLIGDLEDFHRYAAFEPMPLPGGDKAIKAPWRTAVGYLQAAYGDDIPELPFFAGRPTEIMAQMTAQRINCPMTSSCGRLFDAVAVITGGRPEITFEAQAAIEFMQAAGGCTEEPFPFEPSRDDGKGGRIIPVRPLVRAVAKAVLAGVSRSTISRRFHRTLIEVFVNIALLARRDSGIRTVALSGGVFQNQILFEGLVQGLTENGFEVCTHRLVPTNDGGLALGQAVVGRRRIDRNNGYEGNTVRNRWPG